MLIVCVIPQYFSIVKLMRWLGLALMRWLDLFVPMPPDATLSKLAFGDSLFMFDMFVFLAAGIVGMLKDPTDIRPASVVPAPMLGMRTSGTTVPSHTCHSLL